MQFIKYSVLSAILIFFNIQLCCPGFSFAAVFAESASLGRREEAKDGPVRSRNEMRSASVIPEDFERDLGMKIAPLIILDTRPGRILP